MFKTTVLIVYYFLLYMYIYVYVCEQMVSNFINKMMTVVFHYSINEISKSFV